MKGDFTRLSFDADKHYRGVLMQQGRAILDADWNEQVQIAEHRYSTFFRDLVGQSGAPPEHEDGMHLWQDANYALKLSDQAYISISELPLSSVHTIELWFKLGAQQIQSNVVRCLLSLGREIPLAVGVQGGKLRLSHRYGEWRPPDDQQLTISPDTWHRLGCSVSKWQQSSVPMESAEVWLDGKKCWERANEYAGMSPAGENGPPGLPHAPVAEGGGHTPPNQPEIDIDVVITGELIIHDVSFSVRDVVVGAYKGDKPAAEKKPSLFFGGAIAEVRIWDSWRDLSAAVDTHLDGTEEGLIRYYRCDEPDGAASVADRAPKHQHAAIVARVSRCPGPFMTGAILLSGSRYYVDGLLIENEKDNLPLSALTGDGLYLAYLDVWTHHVTAADDADLLEPALGGADTTTRLKTAWRLRCDRLAELNDKHPLSHWRERYYRTWTEPDDVGQGWGRTISTGQLALDTSKVRISDNRLYRVEIHKSGPPNSATFKWSRDNGAVVAPVVSAVQMRIVLASPSPATLAAFRDAAYVEVTDADRMSRGEPGMLARLSQPPIEDDVLIVESWLDDPAPTFGASITVRRWESGPLTAEGAGELEHGLRVIFTAGNAYYCSGDYWLIRVRAGVIYDWVSNLAQAPHGEKHHFAALALVHKQGGALTLLDNLQTTFQPLTSGAVSRLGDTIHGNLCVRGNLSVGTSSNQAPLSIAASDGALISMVDESGDEAWRVSCSTSGTPSLSIADARTQRGLTIQQGGNVGIGTLPTSTDRLAVAGNVTLTNGHLSIANSNNLYFRATADDPGDIIFVDSAGQQKGRIWSDTQNRVNKLYFSSGDITPDIAIDEIGDVGIGIGEPEAKLHIKQQGKTWESGLRITYGANDWAIVADGDDTNKWLTIAPFKDYTRGIVIKEGCVGIGTTNTVNAKLAIDIGRETAASLYCKHQKSNLVIRPEHDMSTATIIENTSGNIIINARESAITLDRSGIVSITDDLLVRTLSVTFIPQMDWKVFDVKSIKNNWKPDVNGTWAKPEYFKDKFGIVHLRGVLLGGISSENTTVLELEDGYKPAWYVPCVVPTLKGVGRCNIYPNGQVAIISGINGWFALDGISFRAGL